MTNLPWEYALIGFEGNQFSGKIVPELLDLAQRGIVRYVDIVFISKEQNGSLRTVELNDLDAESYKMFVPLGEHITGLFTEEDLSFEADRLPVNSSAMWCCGRICGWAMSAKRSTRRRACCSIAGRFPPRWSSWLSRTSPRNR